MPAPPITALPTAPQRTDTSSVFSTRADAWVAAIDNFTDEINAFGDYLDTLGLDPADVPDQATDLDMSTARMLGRLTAATGPVEELTASQVRGFVLNELWVPNFTDDGEVRIYADVAMTVTQQATSGTGTIAYEKSTAAAPSTFSSTTSPITLEAGAWLKVSASSVTGIVAVALKRTA